MFEEAKQSNNQNNQTEEPAMPVAPPENINERIERLHAEGKNKGGKKMAIIGVIAFLIIVGGASAGFMYWEKISRFLGLDGDIVKNNCNYDNPVKGYIGKSAEECAVIKFICEEGKKYFADECGCGCEVVQEEQVFCAQDAKQCPDGSFVSRVAPDCEFAECPEVQEIDISDWQAYRNEEYGFEFKHPASWELIKELQASLSDYIPDNRNFIAIYPFSYPAQDFSARIDVYDIPLDTAMKDNPYIKNVDSAPMEINQILWEKVGSSNYLFEKNERTYHISGENDLLSQVLSAFHFLTDTDSDGLYDDEELKYGTDINNPDSDGDGYLDGAEVENGYNPIGEGVL